MQGHSLEAVYNQYVSGGYMLGLGGSRRVLERDQADGYLSRVWTSV